MSLATNFYKESRIKLVLMRIKVNLYDIQEMAKNAKKNMRKFENV